ncbi:MAG: glycoside hydrolase family 5 protein [Bacteroidetes bacterium]|nr:glycoside hydrolase family 5 protein [Bacteroidota bacterium]MBU1373806.1 glycoside hydrolase family 5 protein [Bacteroidota bacterium]MBU1483853.1 glycoside hydrolase family 5 protein [Bacteroidota bacterium]MBU1761053.1 glycoside hydrolase family 5 protein [Bacteroidota bacterium]MBU2268657.1 glycoside hydrolase family 5 protein [Bacteroidota bacterium]
MPRCKIIFLCVIFLSSCKSQEIKVNPQHSAVLKHGLLAVKNGIIVDKNNLPPELRGISFSWSIWAGQKYYNPDVVDWLVKDFKINILRVAMAVQPDGGYLQNPKLQKELIFKVIDRAIADGIYVLMDWHDHNGNLHIDQAKDFFADVSKKYANSPNMIYEIWNEPERQSWQEVKNYAFQVIPQIRKNTSNLVIVGSPHWDQDVDTVANDPLKGFENIAYSFHFYASDPTHQDYLRSRADKALAKALPLFVTEWGVGESNGDGVFDLGKNAVWMKWLKDNKLSWVNWNITDKKETTAILSTGAPITGRWKQDDLTPAGSYIRNQIRELNK